MPVPILRHARLVGPSVELRPTRIEDAEVAFPMIHGQEPVLEWLVWKGPEDLQALRDRYGIWHRVQEQGHSYALAIVERGEERFIGSIGLRCVERLRHVELGYWIGEAHWGRGYGGEAVALATHLAFTALQASLVTAEVFVGNHASCKVLERSGFRRERRMVRVAGVPEGERGAERWFYTRTRGDFEQEPARDFELEQEIELAEPEP